MELVPVLLRHRPASKAATPATEVVQTSGAASGAFYIAAFGCETGGLKRTARTSSGRTPTACANGTGVRRTPRFFIRKLKYDGSLVNMCLSIIWLRACPP